MQSPRFRLWILLAVAVIVAIGLAWHFRRAGAQSDTARIDRYRERGDVEALAREVSNQKADTAAYAAKAMGTLGRPAAEHLERALGDPRVAVRESAALALGLAAEEGHTAALADAARHDGSATVRAAAVTALGRRRAVDEMEALLAALEDPNRTVRRRAAAAVTRILGRRYEVYVDGPEARRRDAVARLREAWPAMEARTRDYYAGLRKGDVPDGR
jgi:HEAT repeat protein